VSPFEPDLSEDVLVELRGRALRDLGYDEPEDVDPAVLSILDEALDVAAQVVRPAGTYRIVPVLGTTPTSVETEAGPIRSALFARLVGMCSGSRSVVFMVSTLGEALEQTCSAADPVSRQLVFDTVGSELAEMVADLLEADWRKELKRLGLESSERFSPGYCDWALEGQSVVAAALDMEQVGVRLSSHFVMTPRKSVSAVAVAAEALAAPAPCVFCARDDCKSRRLPRQAVADD
jgi:hypothetical protein